MLPAAVFALLFASACGPDDFSPGSEDSLVARCLPGVPPYSFGEWDYVCDGSSLVGTVTDAAGIAERFYWKQGDPVHIGVRPGDWLGGRVVGVGTQCEREFIAALHAFADAGLSRGLQVGVVAAIYDHASLTPEVEAILKSPRPLPLDVIRAPHMARELEKPKAE